MEHIFNETATQARTPASNRLAKAIRASRGPRVKAKERAKRTVENPKDSPKEGSKGAKGSCKGKTSKTGMSGLENMKSVTSSGTLESAQMGHVCTTDTSWSLDEWNDGWSLDEWSDEGSCAAQPQAHFHLKAQNG